MFFTTRFAVIFAILTLSAIPASSKMQTVTVSGQIYLFDIPDGFERESGPSANYADKNRKMQLHFLTGPTADYQSFVGENAAISFKNSVRITRSRDKAFNAASASACGGKCFLVVHVYNYKSPQNADLTDEIFNDWVKSLVARNFESEGHWLVVAGSWPDYSKANERSDLLWENGIAGDVVNTKDYPGLKPGLYAVVLGPTSRELALMQLDAIKSVVPDAFIKESP